MITFSNKSHGLCSENIRMFRITSQHLDRVKMMQKYIMFKDWSKNLTAVSAPQMLSA